jgi:hypothetical protein
MTATVGSGRELHVDLERSDQIGAEIRPMKAVGAAITIVVVTLVSPGARAGLVVEEAVVYVVGLHTQATFSGKPRRAGAAAIQAV